VSITATQLTVHIPCVFQQH